MLKQIEDSIRAKLDELSRKVQSDVQTFTTTLAKDPPVVDERVLQMVEGKAKGELRITYLASYLICHHARMLDPEILRDLSEQIADETKHYYMLAEFVEKHGGKTKERIMQEFYLSLDEDEMWQRMKKLLDANDIIGVLTRLEVVHEALSIAELDVLRKIPYRPLAEMFDEIYQDEHRHHDLGIVFIRKTAVSEDMERQILSSLDAAFKQAHISCYCYKPLWGWL